MSRKKRPAPAPRPRRPGLAEAFSERPKPGEDPDKIAATLPLIPLGIVALVVSAVNAWAGIAVGTVTIAVTVLMMRTEAGRDARARRPGLIAIGLGAVAAVLGVVFLATH